MDNQQCLVVIWFTLHLFHLNILLLLHHWPLLQLLYLLLFLSHFLPILLRLPYKHPLNLLDLLFQTNHLTLILHNFPSEYLIGAPHLDVLRL